MPSLQGHLLVAAPTLLDPNFFRTVVLIVQHNDDGALGLVLNRPTETTVQEAMRQLEEEPGEIEGYIYQGGPCEGPLMMVHDQPGLSEMEVLPGVFFSTDKDSLEQLLQANGGQARFFVGYAGWSAGQLEGELRQGGWLVVPATPQIVFAAADIQWARLLRDVSFKALCPDIDPRLIPDDPSTN
jgi:putative transcriptional regulator